MMGVAIFYSGSDAGYPEWRLGKVVLIEALVVLVIACPCALVISTPVSIVAGLTSAARAGVLIKGGVHLETPAKLEAIAFDKTGTLTYGRPEVQHVVSLSGIPGRSSLSRAASLAESDERASAGAGDSPPCRK